jgi:hypothetical protein
MLTECNTKLLRGLVSTEIPANRSDFQGCGILRTLDLDPQDGHLEYRCSLRNHIDDGKAAYSILSLIIYQTLDLVMGSVQTHMGFFEYSHCDVIKNS